MDYLKAFKMNELLAQNALKLKQNENQFLIIIPI